MLDACQSLIKSTLRKVLLRLHYPLEVMLVCVRWYVAYHTTVHRWALKVLPVLSAVCPPPQAPRGRQLAT
jgi:putative transposase